MRIEPIVHNTTETRRDARLEELSREFEATMVAEVLKSLSHSMAGTGDPSAPGGTLDGLLWQELAIQITSQRQIGLAETIYTQLARSPVSPESAGSPGTPALPPLPVLPASPTSLVSPASLVSAASPAIAKSHYEANEADAKPILPVGGRVSSRFGERRDPINGKPGFHKGIDWAASEGAPVRASEGGKVVFSGQQRGYGNVVILEHAGGVRTLYAHLSRLEVTAGEGIARGELLGEVGMTGRATGPHLHFEVLRDRIAQNPEEWL